MPSSSSEVAAAAVAVAHAPRVSRIFFWGHLPVWLRRTLLLAGLVGIWQLYVVWDDPNPLQFVGPADTAEAFWNGWKDGSLADSTLVTMKVLGLGMAIGTAIAAGLTALATLTRIGDDLLVLLTAMINPIPAIALLPLAMLWFGLDNDALLFVIANAVIWPVAINLSTGFKTVNPTIVAVARNIGLPARRIVTDVLAPAALPHAIAGLRTAWAFGWRTIIAAELVFGIAGSKGGLGWQINEARFYLEIPTIFASLVTIMLIGIAFDAVFAAIERATIVRWGMKTLDVRTARAATAQ